jgi:K+-transporting ATPase ATPase C chain
MDMWNAIRNSLLMLGIFTILTGIVYPLGMTGLAQLLYPGQANGSLLVRDGKVVGSGLIGQNFSSSGYFQGRPSAAGEAGYDAAASSGSNLGPTSQKLKQVVTERLEAVRRQNNLAEAAAIPGDLVLSSASGLDPHITPAAAHLQIERVAKARGLSPEQLETLVKENTEGLQLGIFGEARVNVLALNLALDSLKR